MAYQALLYIYVRNGRFFKKRDVVGFAAVFFQKCYSFLKLLINWVNYNKAKPSNPVPCMELSKTFFMCKKYNNR